MHTWSEHLYEMEGTTRVILMRAKASNSFYANEIRVIDYQLIDVQ